MKLYGYWRSSASYRVRIALNLKGIRWKHGGVNLMKGAQRRPNYRNINPQGFVPTLANCPDGRLVQSLAILEYLDECYPEPPLLPVEKGDRARVRAMADVVACDIHPLNNLRVLTYLTGTLKLDEEAKLAWYRHWVTEGFDALERMLADTAATYCFGERVTMADVCLVPQVANARRFAVDLSPYPLITRIDATCLELEAFDAARPENQPDAEV